MKRLLKTLLNWLKETKPALLATLAERDWRIGGLNEDISRLTEEKEYLAGQLLATQNELNELLNNQAQVRVHGMAERGTVGYGVTMFIPESVLETMRKSNEDIQNTFTAYVAEDLVQRAVRGLWYRNRDNQCSAMIFGDRAKDHRVHAVYLEDANKAPRIVRDVKVPVHPERTEESHQIPIVFKCTKEIAAPVPNPSTKPKFTEDLWNL